MNKSAPSSLSQQRKSLLVIHRLPRDKFLGQHIHSSKEGQLEKQSQKIQVAKHQGAGLSHPFTNPLELERHLGPVQASSVVMTQVVSFVHEVDLIKNGYRMRKVVFGLFRVVEGVLDPCDYCRDEVHAEKRNQHEQDPNSPVVDSDSSEVGIIPRHSP